MKFVIGCIGLVAILQLASAGWPCSAPCGSRCVPGPFNFRSTGGRGGGGCGFSEEELMPPCRDRDAKCVPLVVRPQELPKPALPVAAAAFLQPVPGPCAVKKAIVKPAVLQRPACRPHHSGGGGGAGGFSVVGGGSTCGSSHTFNNHFSFATGGGSSAPLDCTPILFKGHPTSVGNCAENQAHCAPADAVSIALAYQKALEDRREHDFSEGELHFGFKKIPKELPQKKIIKNNVPEEKIFALNGQIVELKPIKIATQKSLDEEAAEQLLALEEEEEARIAEEIAPVRKVSLGEIGYGPAKIKTPTFVNVPVGNVVSAVEDALTSVTGGHGGGHGSYCGGSGGSGGSSSCKVIRGNVIYKTVPKKEQFCLPVKHEADSCESSEESEHQEPTISREDTCTCSCVPVVFKKTHSHHHHSECHKKSRVTVQKISSVCH